MKRLLALLFLLPFSGCLNSPEPVVPNPSLLTARLSSFLNRTENSFNLNSLDSLQTTDCTRPIEDGEVRLIRSRAMEGRLVVRVQVRKLSAYNVGGTHCNPYNYPASRLPITSIAAWGMDVEHDPTKLEVVKVRFPLWNWLERDREALDSLVKGANLDPHWMDGVRFGGYGVWRSNPEPGTWIPLLNRWYPIAEIVYDIVGEGETSVAITRNFDDMNGLLTDINLTLP